MAGGLLIAINPLEKIAKARDATRKATASQLVNALQAYYVLKGGVYPPADNAWITALVNNGDIKNVPPAITSSCTTNNQNGYCYKLSGDGTEAVVYTSLESSERPSGTSGTIPYFLWSSASAESGIYYSFSADITGTSGFIFGPSSTLTQGLVGWWKMNGDAADSSGKGNNGTVTGATPTLNKQGETNKAYSFNGTSDTISIAHNAIFNFGTNGDFAWALWIKPLLVGTRLLYKNPNWAAAITPSGVFWARVWQDGSNQASITGSVSASANIWYHFVVLRRGSSLEMYINGVKDTGASLSTAGAGVNSNIDSTENIYIASEGNLGNWWGGSVDDFRIYNRALSAGEIQNLFSTNP